MKMMACLLDEDLCLERCICPVCGMVHGCVTDISEYYDYIENGPIVGRYPGWDDAYEITCQHCDEAAANMFGEEYMKQLYVDGELEIAAELSRLARLRHGAAVGAE